MAELGKLLIITGIVIAVTGVVLILFKEGVPFLGKLPGDIVMKRKNFTFYFPLATSIVLSIILSLVFYFLGRK
ncbi:MAG: DUF2905 domain-containing protein [Nitrospirae bacterium]|nr:DUF2905 domain-containing protein [Nitrospirota bacterium]